MPHTSSENKHFSYISLKKTYNPILLCFAIPLATLLGGHQEGLQGVHIRRKIDSGLNGVGGGQNWAVGWIGWTGRDNIWCAGVCCIQIFFLGQIHLHRSWGSNVAGAGLVYTWHGDKCSLTPRKPPTAPTFPTGYSGRVNTAILIFWDLGEIRLLI